MSELLDQFARVAESGRPAALATLVAAAGTTPKTAGATMWVGEDGSLLGSVTIGGCVDARVIERADEVYVVAPTLTTWLQSLTGEIDGARASADERLRTVFDHMAASGLESRGTVGDEDQVTALADALDGFSADLILLRLHAPGSRNENWREHRLVDWVRTHTTVPTIVFYFDDEGQFLRRQDATAPAADAA